MLFKIKKWRSHFFIWLGLTHQLLRPSPLAPLPKRERGTRNLLTPLLPFWEKGVGDEGNLHFA
ncbi:MAG: hypothetical protein DCE90_02355 [Pseudanabaena sp.]|nr:MAG: hypothetical protein DCE90_02355 [Pseudanabaena sp.]